MSRIQKAHRIVGIDTCGNNTHPGGSMGMYTVDKHGNILSGHIMYYDHHCAMKFKMKPRLTREHLLYDFNSNNECHNGNFLHSPDWGGKCMICGKQVHEPRP